MMPSELYFHFKVKVKAAEQELLSFLFFNPVLHPTLTPHHDFTSDAPLSDLL